MKVLGVESKRITVEITPKECIKGLSKEYKLDKILFPPKLYTGNLNMALTKVLSNLLNCDSIYIRVVMRVLENSLTINSHLRYTLI